MRSLVLGSLLLLCDMAGAASRADAQAELSGTFIRYLRVGANGALVDPAMLRSTAYSEMGGAGDQSCDLFAPGDPVAGFTLNVTPAGGLPTATTNNDLTSGVTTLSGPTVVGRGISWSGRYMTGTTNVRVDQTVAYDTDERVAVVSVDLTNEGTVALNDVYYFFSGDPDHAQCNIGTTFNTNNDVVRQFPADTSALATATAGTTTSYTFGVGSADSRARANTSGFRNTNAVAAWNTPVDAAGASVDEDIGIAFREATLAPGASTNFTYFLVWGRNVAEVGTRFDAAVAASRELAGTFIRYLRVGTNGALVDTGALRSMQYSELGGLTDQSCDLYGPGTPAAGFTLSAQPMGGTVQSASNMTGSGGIATRSGTVRIGRNLRWAGRWTGTSVNVRVDQQYNYAVADRAASLTVTLTNEGTVALNDVHYFYSGDPDHGNCNIGASFFTNNDVTHQAPAEVASVATATAGDTTRYTLAIGSPDSRSRANNGGFANTAAVTAWSTPNDSEGGSFDEDIGVAFREATLNAGASTTFVIYFAWGSTPAEAESRFEMAAGISFLSPNGAACTTGATCRSTNCVDGVCCDSACGGTDTTDCQACSVAAGAGADGTCGNIAAGTTCRASTDLCDAAETCTGAGPLCPGDGFLAVGTGCRPSAGDCDAAESCSGASAACPVDAFAAAGTACRAAVGACDVAESCSGTGATCPMDTRMADGSPCPDAMACNGTEMCMAGVCAAGAAPVCDDTNACTTDTCEEPGGCTNTPIDGCCTLDADCDDMDMCTTDACDTGTSTCSNTMIAGCMPDAGPAGDGGVIVGDGGVRRDAGTGGTRDDGGCGCSTNEPDGSILVLLGMLVFVLYRRRRR